MKKPLVGVLIGSDSDFEIIQECVKMLDKFDIPYDLKIASAHRTPEKTASYAKSARGKGIKVLIAAAGAAAHLAGVIASKTTLPVIGIPVHSSPLNGLDALLSTAQMPGGVPVATMAIGKAGAKNAAIFAAQVLSLYDLKIEKKLEKFKEELALEVENKEKKLTQKMQLKSRTA